MADNSTRRSRSRTHFEDLSPELRAQALARLAARRAAAHTGGIDKRHSTSAPMSFGQQRLWLIHQLEPDKPTYVAARLYRITGPLDPDALSASLDEVVRRHEALRTSFHLIDGEPVQRIEPHTRLDVPTISLEHLPPDCRPQELERLRAEQGRTPFDLTRGPLLRALIVRLSASEHGLIVARHHIATDRWSFSVLHRELSALYEAFTEGRPSPLPELAIQYSDYALWQREQMQGAAIDRHLAYWKQHLAGAPAHLDLSTDRPRSLNPTYDGAFETMTLPAELIARLRQVAAEHGATPYMLVLGALQVLLHRYTGQDDIVVGSPIAGRLREEAEPLIGFFVNTLALRTNLSGDPTFDEVLDRVRRVTLEAYEHQALPFERLVEELQPSRKVGRNPVIDVVLAYQNVPSVPLRLGAARVEMLETRGDPVTFDLQMTALDTPDGCSVSIDYQRELFDAVTVRRVLGHFETLLGGIADAPATPISRLPLLTPAERRQVLVEWNDACPEFAADATLHGLFEAQAARTPDAVAVSFAGVALSYRELNERATRLAQLLQQSGVERGALVALCLERSEALIVAILAILKAGAAYVPIDPAWPADRATFVVDDAGARAVVTATTFASQFASTGAAVICVDTASLPDIVPSGVPGAPDDLAYVIYTSGTTGRPKGTPVTHHNVVRLFRATRPVFPFGAEHVWTLSHSVAFDFSVWEMWGALLHGARLLVVPAETARDAGDLRALIAREHVTVLCQTPSELTSLIGADAQATHPLSSLRVLVVGGEALPKGMLRPWFARYGDEQPQVINAYGPTETTMFVTCRRVRSADVDGPSLIGRPVADTRAYILDQHREPVPVGVPGELYIGGPGLTRGYLNRPDLTRDAFVTVSLQGLPPQRLYRSGDFARYRPDGEIEFLGRRDQQVKIRGFRIELGEIEAVLASCPGVRSGVVVARENQPGDRTLVAYIVPKDVASPARGDVLRSHLRERLPDYMVPSTFVSVAAIPLTPSGKVDRKALPAPLTIAVERDDFVAPRTREEEVIAGIWADVLGLERVGIQDDFFDIGGHSLLATRVAARLRRAFGTEVPIRMFFDAPTVASLATRLFPQRDPDDMHDDRRDGKGAPLSFAQQRLWLLDQLEPGDPTFNIFDAYRLHGPLRIDGLEKAFARVVERHAVLRATFRLVGDEPRQVVREHERFTLSVHDVRHLAGFEREAAVSRLVDEEAHRPFDLTQDCLLRGLVVRTRPDEHVLLLTVHHIAADAWSLGVIWREITSSYEDELAGRVSGPTAPGPQYSDFVTWERESLTGERLAGQLAYWRTQLADLSPLELPADRPRPSRRAHRGARNVAKVESRVVQRLRTHGREEGATLFATLLAAFQLLLARVTAQDDIVVGSPVANRRQPAFENLVGVFLNTLVLRADASGNPSFREFLGRVRTVLLQALEHQDVPFERLVQALDPARDTSRSPLFQVLFNLTDQDDETRCLQLSGLRVQPFEIRSSRAKYDLTLYLALENGSLHIEAVHDVDLFDNARMRELLDQYVLLLQQVADDADRPVREYSLITAHAQRIVPDPSLPLAFADVYEPVPLRFLARAAERADAVAIRWRGHECRYGALAERATSLASALIARGVVPGDVVALEGIPSIGFMAGMLGTMLAGGVALPLAASLPPARKWTMLRQARAKRLVGCGVIASDRAWRLAEGALDCIDIDPIDATPEQPLASARPFPLPRLDGDAAAYIFFTSGSTGEPKGILGCHRSVAHFIEWQRGTFGVTSEDRVSQLTSPSFDVILRDIFLPLTTGGTLCIPAEPETIHTPAMLRWLIDERISILHVVPSIARRWLEHLEHHTKEWSPRLVFLAGESLTGALVSRWRDAFPGSRVVNLYGPSETCMVKAWHEVPREPSPGVQPVGHPLPHTQLLVLGPTGVRCGIGEPGEIVIRTPFGTLGYLDSAAPAEHSRFRPNPFRDDPRDVVYVSGDVGRYRPDGVLEILGRLDDQVKVRGVRIEPREIEAALESHSSVTASAVCERRDEEGESRLVAYVVTTDRLTADQLRAHLARRLPAFMLPDRFVFLDALPLTANGKLDRRALPEPGRGRPEMEMVYVAPRTAAEDEVARIFCEVLGLDSVGVHDNFFDLGGHSLMATRVIARARNAFGVDVPLRQLFDTPTIAEFCGALQPLDGDATTKIERAVREICRDVLSLPTLDPRDDLFDLGLHSLYATRIIGRIRDQLGAEIPHARLMNSCSVADLVALIREGSGEAAQPAPMPRTAPTASYPLSPGQQQAWILQQLNPDLRVLNEPFTIYLDGGTDTAALARALDALIARHDILRVAIVSEQGQPWQVTRQTAHVGLPVHDLTGWPAGERIARAEALATAHALEPFDLAQPPLFRAMLVRLDAADERLYLTFHHLLVDAVAVYAIFAPELQHLYEAFRDHREPDLPAVPLQYADYVEWQQRLLSPPAVAEHLTFWARFLKDAQPLQLPTDRPRAIGQRSVGARERFTIPADTTAALARWSQQARVTTFSALLAAFDMLLARYTSQTDIAVVTADAGRNHASLESVMGYFVNMLVMRVDLSGDPCFREVAERARAAWQKVSPHRAVDLGTVLEHVPLARVAGDPAPFRIAFVLEPSAASGSGSWRVDQLDVHTSTSKFDLLLQCEERDGEIIAAFEYNTDLFDAATIRHMTGHFQQVLHAVIEDPRIPLSGLQLLTAEERQRMLVDWNQTDTAEAYGTCVHTLFEAQARRTPEAVAIAFEGTTLTYEELDERAERLAGRLRGRGVGPEVLVGLYVERSPDMLVGIIGILKAGGAYVPLDPSHPRERVAFVLEDCAARVVVSQRSLHATLVDSLGVAAASIVLVDHDTDGAAPPTSPSVPAQTDNLAYVLYTSGSTGRPKGVCIAHRSVANLLLEARERLELSADDVVLGSTTYTFDISVAELFLPLVCGARLALVSSDVARDGTLLVAALRATRPTLLQSTPTMWRVLCDAGWTGDATMTCLSIGEQLPLALAREVASRCRRLWNHYGPTETTIWSTAALVDATEDRVSIGRPIANTQVYVLDDSLAPVPPGVAGELFIGGVGLARGYLHRPDLTSERFILNPFIPGERLYRTGDQARWLADGRLECLGRTDRQAKIRGHRVEPAEIELVLDQHPGISASAVDLRDYQGEPRLVAYVVPRDPSAPVGREELRSHVHARLPDYMVPATFVNVAAIPLTTNGKVDRRALPDPPPAAGGHGTYVAPRTQEEEAVALIWAEVFGIERIGINDDFFELGGHSLLAMRVTARAREAFGLQLPLRLLFEAPTVARFARAIESQRMPARKDGELSRAIPAATAAASFPLSFAQRRLWFLAELEPESTAYNMSRALHVRGPLDTEALRRAFETIVERHAALRTTFASIDHEPRQIVHPPAEFALDVTDLTGVAGDREAEIARQAGDEARRRFDLQRDRMLRARVLRLSPEEHVLLITLHHIASDGWSMGVLWHELRTLYTAYTEGGPCPLPPLERQYHDYAVWQLEWLRGDRLAKQMEYWRAQMKDLQPLELPTDHARPPRLSYRGAREDFSLDRSLSRDLQQLARDCGATPFMVLLAAFQLVLARCSGQTDIAVGTPIANRLREELEPLIGFFVNTLVLRVDVARATSFRDLIALVRRASLEAYDHQDLPFEKLVEELRPARELNRNPLVQVLFALQNAPDTPPSLPGLVVTVPPHRTERVRFDLELHIHAAEDGAFQGALVYSTDLFDARRVIRLVQAFGTTLRSVAAQPDAPLAALALHQADDQLVPGRRSDALGEGRSSVPEVFEEAVARTPMATAVADKGGEVTYAELNSRANRLARLLRDRGVRPDDSVALCLDRSTDALVSLLGILKAGGAYVPIDLTHPAARVTFQLREAQARWLITRTDLAASLPPYEGDILWLDAECQTLTRQDDTNLPAVTTPDHLAYVLFTSGSTGQPNGVAMRHGPLVNLIRWHQQQEQLQRPARTVQFAPLTFDVSFQEIFTTWCTGGTVIIVRDEVRRDIPALLRHLEDQRVDRLYLPFVALRYIAEIALQARLVPKTLRDVISAGESLHLPGAIRQFIAAIPGCRLHNHYGPTETHVVTAFTLPEDTRTWPATAPIGRPISNVEIHLLDAALRPVPRGGTGEVFVGGVALARGYLHRPELTSERFVPDPSAPAQRLYRTGDLARYLPDGNLEFLGRKDDQVKIRGYRVEPGEVEAVLGTHPSVRACAVAVRKDPAGDACLVAFFVAQANARPTPGELRSLLRAHVPDYMVPAAFVNLPSLPISPNGKVDRRALAARDHSLPAAEDDAPRQEGLHHLFAEQVERRPNAVAVSCGNQSLTYRELDNRATRLAQLLLERGVARGALVAFCLDRSPDLIVAILAILKAGAAYVPIDPAYPPERATFIVEDAAAALVLTETPLRSRFAHGDPRVVCLDSTTLPSRVDSTTVPVSADDLAYVIYTSGTTGRPKGTLITHNNVLRLFRETDGWFGFNDRDVWTLFHSAAFDFSVWEIWGALLHGGRLVIVPSAIVRDPNEFHSLLAREGVTVLNQTPSALGQLIDADQRAPASQTSSLRYIILGGEALPMRMLRPWFCKHGDMRPRVINMYGITETTVHVTYRPVGIADLDGPSLIGRPIPDLSLYVLDATGAPAPVGVPGEIHVAGPGLARGYLNLPGLTSEKFVTRSVGGAPPQRLYRSGDLARCRDDGDIEYLGRIDQQVKIRGYRVELAEIEAVLASHPDVAKCVVLAREDRLGDTRLVGYIVATQPGASLSRDALRAHLRKRLPDYMTPAVFVQIAAIPLTTNGKIDRSALPSPEAIVAPVSESGDRPAAQPDAPVSPVPARSSRPQEAGNGDARPVHDDRPRTPLEEMVASVWADVLRLPRVGVDDNFFDLGGHSLVATQAVTRLRALSETEVPLRTIFEAPTVAGFAKAIAALRAERGQVSTAEQSRFQIQPCDTTRPALLSFAQQRLWFIDQLEAGGDGYRITQGVRIRGALDIDALRLALDGIVQRHATLRTTFAVIDGEPRQVVHATGAFPIDVIDLSGFDESDRDIELTRRRHAEASRPFDLAHAFPVRAYLYRVSAIEHVLVVAMHHIASDGWSLGVFWREVGALYEAALNGSPVTLGPLPVQYADFAAWQRQRLQGPYLDRQIAYWRAHLQGLPPLDLPTDRPRPLLASHQGARHAISIDAQTVDQLSELALRENVTRFMAVLAVFQLLLARYSGQDDVAIGTPVAGRSHPDVERLIGFFVNTLVMRTDLSGTPSFRELLARVRRVALEAYDHQELPFEKLVEELQPERDGSRNPLVQVVLTLQAEPGVTPRLGNLELLPAAGGSTRVRFDLELHLHPRDDGSLAGSLHYCTDLFDASSMARFAAHFEALLRSAVATPDASVWSLPMLADAERARLVTEWNATSRPLPALPVHRLFEAQARETPDAIALTWRGDQVTYDALNHRANRLARHLRAHGVGPDVVVAVALNRSIDLVVTLIAVLKAGGAYLPLDPSDASSRITRIVRDCAPRVLVVSDEVRATFAREFDHVVHLHTDAARIADQPRDDLDITVDPEALAYVMYTSGSTGEPKGVEIPHRAIVRLVHADVVPIAPGDAVLQLAPMSFDASTFEVWAPLLRGARCALYPDPTLNLATLEDVIRRERITRLWLTASLFNTLIDERPEALAGLEWLLAGGEALSVPHVRRAQNRHPALRIVNGYGPTEATTFSCTHRIEAPLRGDARAVPIGRPIANTVVFVLDRHGQPVPIGVAGELFIGGPGLARGYRNRNELTAVKFTERDIDGYGRVRLYATGDRVRYRPDGALEFLGRFDRQVKIRGFRIEPSEVEAVLESHPAVHSCVVTVPIDGNGHKRLVAYVVPAQGAARTDGDLAEHMRAHVPDYMVPSAFVFLDAMPLTPNGKIDRQALPVPGVAIHGTHAVDRPVTSTEARLLRLWREVLRVESVGLRDDFFTLGGHSLRAVQLFSRIEREFGRGLSLGTLFSHSTVEDLARVLDGASQVEPWRPLVPIRATGTRRPLFLVHGIGGEVLGFRAFASYLSPDQPVYGIQGAGPNANVELPVATDALAARYVDLVLSVDPIGPYLLGGYSSGGVLALEVGQQLLRRGKQVALLLVVDGGLPRCATEPHMVRHSPLSFLRQAWYWLLDDALALPAAEWWKRLRSKGRLFKARFEGNGNGDGNGRGGTDIRDALGMWNVPDGYREYLRIRYDAFRDYVAAPFAGRIALIRSRTGRLLGAPPCVLDAAWRDIARGGLDVVHIAGSHTTVLQEPHVRDLAREAQALLDRATNR